jgi:hypothetical protein
MKFINANKLHRKSGGVGHPSSASSQKLGVWISSLLLSFGSTPCAMFATG